MKGTNIDGDLTVGRNVSLGGKLTAQGDGHIKGGLKVEGWLDAKNIKAANKGLFASKEQLDDNYPKPLAGWFAIVIDDIEEGTGFLYRAIDGKWAKTGEQSKPYEFIMDSANVFAICANGETFEFEMQENEGHMTFVTLDGTPQAILVPAANELKAGVMSAKDKTNLTSLILGNAEPISIASTSEYIPKADKSGGSPINGYVRATYEVIPGDKIHVYGVCNIPSTFCAAVFMGSRTSTDIIEIIATGTGFEESINVIATVPDGAKYVFLADNQQLQGLKLYKADTSYDKILNLENKVDDIISNEFESIDATVISEPVANTGTYCFFIPINSIIKRDGSIITCRCAALSGRQVRISDATENKAGTGEDRYPTVSCNANGEFSFIARTDNDLPYIRVNTGSNIKDKLYVYSVLLGLRGLKEKGEEIIESINNVEEDVTGITTILGALTNELSPQSTNNVYLPKIDNSGGTIVSGYTRAMYQVEEGMRLHIYGKCNVPTNVCAVSIASSTSASSIIEVVQAGTGEESVIDTITVVPNKGTYLFVAYKDNNIKVSLLPNNNIDNSSIKIQAKYAQNILKCYPYMQQTMGDTASTKIPRYNILCPDDFNNRMHCFKEAVEWAISDEGIQNSIQAIFAAGDLISAAFVTKAKFAEIAAEMFSYVKDFPMPVLVCIGNHDIGQDGNYDISQVPSLSEIKSIIMGGMINALRLDLRQNLYVADDADACYYYYDDSVRKVRLIALNDYESPRDYYTDANGVSHLMYNGTHNEGSTHANAQTLWNVVYYSEKQLNWLIDVLDSTPSDYTVITNNHVGLKDKSSIDYSGSYAAMVKIINAYKDKKSGSVVVNPVYRRDINGVTDEVLLDGFTVSYDFSKVAYSKIIHHNGHDHNFLHYTSFGGNVPCIQTMCTYSVVNTPKYVGGLTETSCDIISIDQNKNEMYVVRYGFNPRRANESTKLDMNGFNYIDNPIEI